MDDRSRSPGRILAPVALVVAAILTLVIASSSGVNEDSKSRANGGRESQQALGETTESGRTRRGRRGRLPSNTYTVKSGDTLAGIGQKTGLSVDKLQELNPDLDPQALVSGQKIKLKE